MRLLRAASAARRHARAKHSGFRVGAALLTATGEIVTGANVESDSYGLTCCAERVALFKALTEGKSRVIAVAIVARIAGGPMPCGACRQLLVEYASNAVLWVADSRQLKAARKFLPGALLPQPFVYKPSITQTGKEHN